MQIYNSSEKIERYLDDLAVEYKEMLLNRLLEESGNIENLNISEMLRIDAEIKKPLLRNYRRVRMMQRRLFYLGMGYATVGIVFFLFELYPYIKYNGLHTMNGVSVLSLLIMLMGFVICLMAIMIPFVRKYTGKIETKNIEYNRAIWEYSVVKTWRTLEGIAADIYGDAEKRPINSIINILLADNYINKVEAEVLREFLKMRNSVAHGLGDSYKLEEIMDLLKRVDNILNNFKRTI